MLTASFKLSCRPHPFVVVPTHLALLRSFHPMLTPAGCAGGARLLADPPLTPRRAADIYAGKLQHEWHGAVA